MPTTGNRVFSFILFSTCSEWESVDERDWVKQVKTSKSRYMSKKTYFHLFSFIPSPHYFSS